MLELDLAEDLLSVTCDKNRITQVVINLLNNAIKYSPEYGVIKIYAKMNKNSTLGQHKINCIHVSVMNQGENILEGERKLIFEKFTRGSKKDYKSSGTGLGLAICKDIIAEHHGKIWTENAENGGAVFHFLLPVNQ